MICLLQKLQKRKKQSHPGAYWLTIDGGLDSLASILTLMSSSRTLPWTSGSRAKAHKGQVPGSNSHFYLNDKVGVESPSGLIVFQCPARPRHHSYNWKKNLNQRSACPNCSTILLDHAHFSQAKDCFVMQRLEDGFYLHLQNKERIMFNSVVFHAQLIISLFQHLLQTPLVFLNLFFFPGRRTNWKELPIPRPNVFLELSQAVATVGAVSVGIWSSSLLTLQQAQFSSDVYSAYSNTSSAPAANMCILIVLIYRAIKLFNSIWTEKKKKNVYLSYCYLTAEFSRDLRMIDLAFFFGQLFRSEIKKARILQPRNIWHR